VREGVGRLTLVLGLVMAIGPLAIDMYLPALPALQTQFGTSAARVQHTLSAYLFGLALGQLAFGPIADRYGRKPALVAGLALFVVATVGCVAAGTIEQLVGLRFVQALGGASGMVVIRAVIRDRFDEIQSARVLSLMMLVMGARRSSHRSLAAGCWSTARGTGSSPSSSPLRCCASGSWRCTWRSRIPCTAAAARSAARSRTRCRSSPTCASSGR
jgi:MFS family permease